MRRGRVSMVVHRSGKIYIAVAIVLAVLAICGGNNFHYLAAASMLGYMAVSGETGKFNIRGASVSLFLPDEIYAGTPFFATVEVTNTKRFQAISLLDVSVLGGSAFFSVILPKEKKTATIELVARRRGANDAGSVTLRSPYPFNLFTCSLLIPCHQRLTVFPEPLRADDSARMSCMVGLDEMDEALSRPGPQKRHSDSDIAGVRPYAEGDPMKLIHWKSSAKTGRLKSRLYEPLNSGKVIDLDRLTASGVERGLSCASWEIKESIRTGEAIGLLDRGNLLDVSGERQDKLSMLAALALYE
ncbi:MAG: DUF58 domain-containing protein [Synergistaceae bacterium]|nr:DUF58 domain-containing protein [Synergistaceae bacterium]